MTIVVKIADKGYVETPVGEALSNLRNRLGRVVIIDRNPNELRTGLKQVRHLICRSGSVSRVGIGHGLHHDRVSGTYRNPSNGCRNGASTCDLRHENGPLAVDSGKVALVSIGSQVPVLIWVLADSPVPCN